MSVVSINVSGGSLGTVVGLEVLSTLRLRHACGAACTRLQKSGCLKGVSGGVQGCPKGARYESRGIGRIMCCRCSVSGVAHACRNPSVRPGPSDGPAYPYMRRGAVPKHSQSPAPLAPCLPHPVSTSPRISFCQVVLAPLRPSPTLPCIEAACMGAALSTPLGIFLLPFE